MSRLTAARSPAAPVAPLPTAATCERIATTTSPTAIPANQLRYWPRFPLSVLQQPANLARLVAVLDRLATESHTARPIEA